MSDWIKLVHILREDQLCPADLKRTTREFMELFFSCYDKSFVTPYLHIFVAHLHEFKQIHRTVNNFNIQGLEKLNDLTTMQFFKQTNKRKTNKRRQKHTDITKNSEAMDCDDSVNISIDSNHLNEDEDKGSASSNDECENKIWLKQIFELRNRNDEQSFMPSF